MGSSFTTTIHPGIYPGRIFYKNMAGKAGTAGIARQQNPAKGLKI